MQPERRRCEVCERTFLVGGRGNRAKHARFCSRSCANTIRHDGPKRVQECVCQQCGKSFTAYVVRGGHTGKYCGVRCYHRARTGREIPGAAARDSYRIYGGYRWIRAEGPERNPRRRATAHGRKKLRSGHYVQEHVAVAERALGRPLKKGEVVHHFNLNKLDNRPSNLMICTQEYHRFIHHRMELAWVREHLTP